MPDPSEGAMEGPGATKAYYEVILKYLAVEPAVARLLASVSAMFAGNDHFVVICFVTCVAY